LYLETYEEFDWIIGGIYVGFNSDWLNKMMKEPVRNEIVNQNIKYFWVLWLIDLKIKDCKILDWKLI